MISTKEQLFESTAKATAISKELAEILQKSTRNKQLREIIDAGGENIVIYASLRDVLKDRCKQISDSIQKAREHRTGVGLGGRPKLSIPDNLEDLDPKERLRIQNRLWKRNQRQRDEQKSRDTGGVV